MRLGILLFRVRPISNSASARTCELELTNKAVLEALGAFTTSAGNYEFHLDTTLTVKVFFAYPNETVTSTAFCRGFHSITVRAWL